MDVNTMNSFAHFKTKHPEMYLEVKKLSSKTEKVQSAKCCHPNQLSIIESFLRGKKLDTSSREHTCLTQGVTYWFAKDSQPEYTVK